MPVLCESIYYYLDPGSGLPFLNFGAIILGFLAVIFGFLLSFFKRFFKKKFILIFFLLVIFVFLFIFLRTNMTGGIKALKSEKVIILGMDGLDPGIMERMMEEGRLPNFSQLRREGSYSRLSTSNPSESAVAWTCFYTGENPGKHGIYDFILRRPDNYLPYLSLTNTAAERNYINFLGIKIPWVKQRYIARYEKGLPFWKVTSRYGVPNVILFCPNTFPADKIKGKMLSGMGVTDLRGTMGTFSFYTTAPANDKKDTGGIVYNVEVKNNKIATFLSGPRDTSGRKVRDFTIPMSIDLYPREKRIIIDLDKQKIKLNESEWSGWVRVQFKLGAFKTVSGICKFYLKQIEPVFQLYVSAINIDPENPVFPISYPENYSKEVAREVGLFSTLGMPHDTWSLNEDRIDYKIYLEQSDELFSEKKTILEKELKKFKKGVFYFYFGTPDSLQHMFWRFTDPKHPNYDAKLAQLYGGTIAKHYEDLDKVLGLVMDKYLDNNTTLIVLSDHGFSTFRRVVHINSWLVANGFMYLTNGSKEGGDLFANVDWSKTQAYSVGFGGIYINQVGRESEGIVYPGKDTEELKKTIKEKLLQLKDPKTQEKVINNAYLKEEIFWGPYTNDAPDLFIGFKKGFRASWQTALGAAPLGSIIEDNMRNWGGDHLMDPALLPGILFTNKKIKKEHPAIIDIAPTILQVYGIKIPQEVDGKPLF